jgi:molybdate-binding protein/DNA-binding transcriptional regulator YhcF (GntR family)
MDNSNPFLYLQIAETIRRRIISGELEVGDKLPSVRELAAKWDCTPGTVNHAYQVLTQEGLLVGQRGKGTLVAPSMIQSQNSKINWAALINRAEMFLLEALQAGHSPVEIETALSMAIARWRDLRVTDLPELAQPLRKEGPLRFVGSHDLAVELLPRLLGENSTNSLLEIRYSGSLGGLISLSRKEADLAGAHLWDETTDTYNVPFIKRVLPGWRVVLLTVAHRQLGLILSRKNPNQVKGLEDLASPSTRFVNRQPGSGSRVWLDAHLQKLGLKPAGIPGYEREETTHLGVANAIAMGEANAGLGVFGAAASFNLDFISLARERYDLVIPEAVWALPQTKSIVRVIRSEHFREIVQALGGYETAETGRETWVG